MLVKVLVEVVVVVVVIEEEQRSKERLVVREEEEEEGEGKGECGKNQSCPFAFKSPASVLVSSRLTFALLQQQQLLTKDDLIFKF